MHGKKIGLVDPSGVFCRIVDFPAVGNSEDNVNIMHRTQSVDFGVVLRGTIKLILDDGLETTMNEGDVVVQRATIHVSACACNLCLFDDYVLMLMVRWLFDEFVYARSMLILPPPIQTGLEKCEYGELPYAVCLGSV